MTIRALSALLLLTACGPSPEEATLPTEPPYLRGVVTDIAGSEIRVEENAAEPAGSPKAVLRLGRDSRILWRTGEAADQGDLRLGTRVSVWVSGPVAESYPARATADVLVIESTTPPAEPQL